MDTHETDHLAAVRALAPECMVLLRSDGAFPLAEPGEIALFGSGARHTIKGGTGSGDVNSRHVTTIEEGLETAGFTIATRPWLEAYDRVRAQAHEDFIAGIRAEAAERGLPAIMVGMGSVMPEPEYTIPLDVPAGTDPHAAVYVLSRTSGEGSDRTPEAGDLRLTDTEVRDILTLNGRFERFLLVLNVGGVVDLSPLDDVANILLLSQLGTCTGDAFTDILLGRTYPSGKLATTWAAWDEDDQIGDFGDPDDTHYREGLYIGYRFYDSVGKTPLLPFGFGLGYTTFDIQTRQVSLDGARVSIDVDVTNTGERPGKETIQVYASVPAGRLDQPLQALAGFTKTDEIAPGATARITVDVDLTDLASYDEAARATILEAGRYLLQAGTSSRHLSPVAVVELAQDATVRHLTGDLGEPGFTDWKPEAPILLDIPAGLPVLAVDPTHLRRPDVAEPDERVAPEDVSKALTLARGLCDDELTYTVLGDYRSGEESGSVIGAASTTVIGAAGQTTTRIPGLPSIIMADGPAGLRLAPTYGVDAEGPFSLGDSSLPATFLELMDDAGREALGIADASEPREPTEIREQYTTAIPIGTALAQSWNPALAQRLGDVVGAEMERFGIHLWLAPAINLHRSVLCGRNFEYLSEDPLLAGRIAAAITRGVQTHPGRGATIKHLACNNQETNRLNSNSRVSPRALRDLYLRAFEICVRQARPAAVMTSYNLINGVHTSESAQLLEVILRREWGFDGLVMTDWVVDGMTRSDMKHPRATAAATIKAGGELFMPGGETDRQDLLAALERGSTGRGPGGRSEPEDGDVALMRDELETQAARVIRSAWRLAGFER
ncbi:glycoside hydrolase family 3 N-terminal domain-containing protein [Actinomyces oris]|uniref:Glycoside hydrolase family 3 N-terminal domain-containing protein n=1 Tax=Actinomyces oris TaxID=544580 RepID=A0AAW9KH50_9ACTO|nr:glycoside hydrolase family 3 N-terminal domain-containing protein [Actinomyces oris]MEA1303701.1 glycoside hydrolase family 3 N-terminal domain-containing protein [Actinomyces oris]